ncbi:hypothetical protein NJ76_15760, partial [Rhodococcus sp. IITR03]
MAAADSAATVFRRGRAGRGRDGLDDALADLRDLGCADRVLAGELGQFGVEPLLLFGQHRVELAQILDRRAQVSSRPATVAASSWTRTASAWAVVSSASSASPQRCRRTATIPESSVTASRASLSAAAARCSAAWARSSSAFVAVSGVGRQARDARWTRRPRTVAVGETCREFGGHPVDPALPDVEVRVARVVEFGVQLQHPGFESLEFGSARSEFGGGVKCVGGTVARGGQAREHRA